MKYIRILAIVLAAVMALSLFGCGETTTEKADAPQTDEKDSTTEAADTEGQTQGETTEAESSETEEATTEAETGIDIVDGVINIGTREELFAFADSINIDYEFYTDITINITANIDLTPTLEGGRTWTPIDGEGLEYCTINGGGHVINGMTITADDMLNTADGYGFGFIGIQKYDIEINDIIFANAVIEPNTKHTGCVMGEINSGATAVLNNVTVDNLYANGGVGTWESLDGIAIRVGGMIGTCAFGGYIEMTDCSVKNSKLIGFHNISGLVGNIAAGSATFEGCSVENTVFHFSAGFSQTYDQEVARYFTDPFYCVNDEWELYHGDDDAASNNTFTGCTFYDMAYEVTYKDGELKSADYDGEFPV